MTVFTKQDRIFMRKAINLAEKGRGKTRPNPLVGAIIVKDGAVVSTGYHRKAGSDHAEVDAIKNSPVGVNGSDLYVTLEPCSTHGRTPPCTETLIGNGFKKVIIGALDPNPLVNGKGIKKLKKAGINVKSGLFSEEIARQNEVFFKHIRSKSPFVCAKIASSIDGKLAARSSDSKWITSTSSREIVQELRIEYGAILTGINTIISDNPTLFPKTNLDGKINDNLKSFLGLDYPEYFRIILDTDLRIPLSSNIVKTANNITTVIITSDSCKRNSGMAKKIQKLQNFKVSLEFIKGKIIDIEKILKILYSKYGISSIMLEAGPSILTSFLVKRLIDKFVIFMAPKIIGGDSPYDMFGKLENDLIGDSAELDFFSFEKVGSDIMITAYQDNKNRKVKR